MEPAVHREAVLNKFEMQTMRPVEGIPPTNARSRLASSLPTPLEEPAASAATPPSNGIAPPKPARRKPGPKPKTTQEEALPRRKPGPKSKPNPELDGSTAWQLEPKPRNLGPSVTPVNRTRSTTPRSSTPRSTTRRKTARKNFPHKVPVFEDGALVKDDSQVFPDSERPLPSSSSVAVQPRKELRCYEVLGLTRSATIEQVRQAYKKKALEAHPDRPHGAHDSFLNIAEAFETLSDHHKRELYDRELVVADSQDGLKAQPRRSFTPRSATSDNDNAALEETYQHFMTLPASEWSKSIRRLDTILLDDLLTHVDKRSSEEAPPPREDGIKSTSSAPVQKSAAKGMHLYCTGGNFWCAQIVVNGLEVRSMSTKSMGQAAAGHVALLAYKEFLLAHTREEREHNFEACSRKALALALAQNLDVAGDHFAYSFRKDVKLHGMMQKFKTPASRDLDTALRHRRELLEMIGWEFTIAQISQRLARMRCEVSVSSSLALGSRRRMQYLLVGYLQCEIEQRHSKEMSEPKKRRLLGKQSDALVHFRLPWFSQFAKHHGLSRSQLLPHLRSLQECLQRSPHLQTCVQSALTKCLEDPEPDHLAVPRDGQHRSDDRLVVDAIGPQDVASDGRRKMSEGAASANLAHARYLSGNCNGGTTTISCDDEGEVWVSMPRGQQPYDTRDTQMRAKDHDAGMAEAQAAMFAAVAEKAKAWCPPKNAIAIGDMPKQEMKLETCWHAGSQGQAKLEPIHIDIQLQDRTGRVEQPDRKCQAANQMEEQTWSWTAAPFPGTSPAPGSSKTRSSIVEVD